jgi:4-hydroxybenzoate polyprenyltransferase
MSWSTLEHLSLATYAFPLMVKSIMSINNYYELSKKDQKDIQKFEHLANDKFLDNP